MAQKVKDEDKMYLRDDIATMILGDPNHKDYVASIIALTIGLDKEYVMENLEYYNGKLFENIKQKHSEADSIFEIPDGYINIEVNYNSYKEGKIKNTVYVLHLVIRQTKPNEPYKNIKKVWQINLNNFDYYGKNDFIYHSTVMSEKYHLKHDDLFEIVDINLDFLVSLDYTEIAKLNEEDLKWLLYVFVCKDKNLRQKIYQDNEMMERVGEKMKELSGDFDERLFYNKEEFQKRAAYLEGQDDEKVEIAKAMFDKAPELSIEKISDITGLSIKEITSLKQENSSKN